MKKLLSAAVTAALAVSMPVLADDHDDYMLDIQQIEVKLGHQMKFRDGVKAYIACYEEAGGEGSWSAWRNVDGDGITYHVVSQMNSWAEMDEDDDASMACRSTVEEQIAPHMASVSRMVAKRLPGWSGSDDGEEETVVRLHNFRVADGWRFRAAVDTITGIMKAAEYEHMGTWYRVEGGGPGYPEYFVAAGYKDFAEMDEDRPDPYDTTAEHAGEDAADLVWSQFRDAQEDNSYWSSLLQYDEALSYSDDD